MDRGGDILQISWGGHDPYEGEHIARRGIPQLGKTVSFLLYNLRFLSGKRNQTLLMLPTKNLNIGRSALYSYRAGYDVTEFLKLPSRRVRWSDLEPQILKRIQSKPFEKELSKIWPRQSVCSSLLVIISWFIFATFGYSKGVFIWYLLFTSSCLLALI